MKTTINFYQFADAFGRIRPDNFSREGLSVLWEYLDNWEADAGEELELDVIAFCCDFSEATWREIADYYDIDLDGCEDDDEKAERVQEYLEDNGAFVGEVSDGFVYRDF